VTPLLEIRELVAAFPGPGGEVRAVDGVSLTIGAGEVVGLVGESGCGKSVLALSALRLLPPPGRIAHGAILWRGEDLMDMPGRRLRRLRGKEIALILQEPATALNPVFTIGNQIAETIVVHKMVSWKQARARAVELLRAVAIPDPEVRARQYPHEISGGMRQRVLVALAICCDPALIIADEPTTALDVTLQAEILELLDGLRRERGMALLLITHDMGVVAQLAERVIVMYCGRIVEEAPVRDLFREPTHPYTRGLLASIPGAPGAAAAAEGPGLEGARARLAAIPGMVPDLSRLPEGCNFGPRCPHRFGACESGDPPLYPIREGWRSACELYGPRGSAAARGVFTGRGGEDAGR
jgi:oligopeptide/dipeptide ABC transporter ATP-binding protein